MNGTIYRMNKPDKGVIVRYCILIPIMNFMDTFLLIIKTFFYLVCSIIYIYLYKNMKVKNKTNTYLNFHLISKKHIKLNTL